MNHFVLTAQIAQAGPLRYTPAGIAALDLVLEHEASIPASPGVVSGFQAVGRQVKLTLKAVCFASLAESAARLELGKSFQLQGYLMNARTRKSIVFHIESITTCLPAEAGQH